MKQREIKFRARLKERSEMVEAEEIDFVRGCICHENVQRDWPLDEEPRSETDPIRVTPLEQVELMQFTGLRDKDGKEIYEGDVVEALVPSVYFDGDYVRERRAVLFHDFAFGLGNGTMAAFVPFTDIHPQQRKEIKVIGNVFENPELLEKKRYAC